VDLRTATPAGTSGPETYTYVGDSTSGGSNSGGTTTNGGNPNGSSSSSAGRAALANTGAPIQVPLTVGLLFLLGGALLLWIGRRRNEGSASTDTI
jgi:LPXTG-motif cell wall-anchored protein